MFEDPDQPLIYSGPTHEERSWLWSLFATLLLGLGIILVFVVMAHAQPVKPFITDGCSGGLSAGYRALFHKPPPYESCCITHDRSYWQGGTADARASADKALYLCVKRAGYPKIAVAMWVAVRPGGTPFMPFDWRWGFGNDWGTREFYERHGARAN